MPYKTFSILLMFNFKNFNYGNKKGKRIREGAKVKIFWH